MSEDVEPVVLRSHYAPGGSVERVEVLEAPPLSLISPELLAEMDPRYRDGDVLTLAPDVCYRIGAEHGGHGERLLHRFDPWQQFSNDDASPQSQEARR